MSKEMRQFILSRTPEGNLSAGDFELQTVARPVPADGEVLVKARLISLDPANRGWMSGKTYRDQVMPGDVMAGAVLGDVVESNHPAFDVGDRVFGDLGWREFAVSDTRELEKMPKTEPDSLVMSAVTSRTAYFGLLDIGKPQPGETLVVSGAAGATGSVAAQIGKLKGCRVIGLAGTDAKCDWLTGEAGLDAAINYRKGSLSKQLREACPKGIDIYFDNTAGDILNACLRQMRMHGRIVCCGAISSYDSGEIPPGPVGVPGILIVMRLEMKGFIVFDFAKRFPEADAELAAWAADGKLIIPEDILPGFESLPEGLVGLLAGENLGKRMVRVTS